MTAKLLTNVEPLVGGLTIGLIGAGRMGTGIGLSLRRHGASVFVKGNVRFEGVERLLKAGAYEAATTEDIAKKCSIIVLSLPSSREVEQVCLTEKLFEHLHGFGLVIDCTTSTPQSTLHLASEAQKHGIMFVDAPVTRSPEQAMQGQLNAMVGADTKAFPFAVNILAAFCESITHVGPVGEGHKMKLVYNGMTMGLAAVAAETCQLANSLGVDLDALRTVVSRGSTNSGIFQKFAAFLLGEQPDTLGITINNAAKDIDCALALAEQAQIPVPVLTAASGTLQLAITEGRGDLTLPHIAQCERPEATPTASSANSCRS